MAFATPVGWIAARNTLLATCFGFACILLHDRAKHTQASARLDVHAARSWFMTQFARARDVTLSPFRVGDRIALAHLTVEVREVDVSGAPTRARFTFDRPLDDPGLAFRAWEKSGVATWTPPAIGGRLQVPAPTSR